MMNKDYKKFGELVWEILKNEGLVFAMTEDNEIANLAVECGLAVKAPYDPKLMRDVDCAEYFDDGQAIYYWGTGYQDIKPK